MADLTLLENTTQEQLKPYEEGQAFRRLHKEFGYSTREIAKMHGVSHGYVTNRMAIADLPEDSPLAEAARTETVNMTTIQTLRQMMRERPMEEVLDLLERAKRDEITSDDVRDIRASYQATIPSIIAETSDRPVITISLADQERARQEARDAERARGEEFYREFTAAQRSGELPPVTDAPFMEAPAPEPIRVHARLVDPEEEHWERIAPNETTSREAAHHAFLQLRAIVPALRAKLRRADLNELPQHEQQEWRRLVQELFSLLSPSVERAQTVEAIAQATAQLDAALEELNHRQEDTELSELATLLGRVAKTSLPHVRQLLQFLVEQPQPGEPRNPNGLHNPVETAPLAS